jgi:hypothetical protein
MSTLNWVCASYDRLLSQLLHDLSEIETEEASHKFSSRAERQLRKEAPTVDEFYVREFLKMPTDAVASQAGIVPAECQQAISEAKLDASMAKVELQARLETASAAGDREAEHAVWREREKRQAACQAKVDAATARIDLVGFRVTALGELASTFSTGNT